MISTIQNNQNVLKFLKFYFLGFLISLSLLVLVHTYGFFVDSIYSYQKFSESFIAVVIFSFPYALHLWIMENLTLTKTFAKTTQQMMFKILASYWIGNIIGFILMGLLCILNLFVSLPLIEFFTEDRLITLSLIAGIPMAILFFYFGYENWKNEPTKI